MEQLQQEFQMPPWEQFDREDHRPFGWHLLQLPPQAAAVADFVSVLIDPWPITAICFSSCNYSLTRMLETRQGKLSYALSKTNETRDV
jgi:hypothetical protein